MNKYHATQMNTSQNLTQSVFKLPIWDRTVSHLKPEKQRIVELLSHSKTSLDISYYIDRQSHACKHS